MGKMVGSYLSNWLFFCVILREWDYIVATDLLVETFTFGNLSIIFVIGKLHAILVVDGIWVIQSSVVKFDDGMTQFKTSFQILLLDLWL